MSQDSSPRAVLDEIAALPRGDDLARLVHTVAFAAADERRGTLSEGLAEVAERAGLKPRDAETSFGNALRALERGGAEAAGSATRALLAGLLARGVALSPPVGADAEARVAEALLWLAAHTSVDALTAIDAALVDQADKADGLWLAVAALVRKIDGGSAPLLGRPGAIIGAAALRESASEAAQIEAAALSTEVRDPIVRSVLALPEASISVAEPTEGPRLAGQAGASAAVVTGELVGPAARARWPSSCSGSRASWRPCTWAGSWPGSPSGTAARPSSRPPPRASRSRAAPSSSAAPFASGRW